MVRDSLKRLPNYIWTIIGGSIATTKRFGADMYRQFQIARDRIPVYEIQHDGTIKRYWENPHDKENRAYDLEHNHKNQIFMKGYSNALDVSVDSVEQGEVSLHPSEEYQTYMKQKVLSDSMMAGSDTMTTVKYLTMANLAMIVIAVLIGVSLAT